MKLFILSLILVICTAYSCQATTPSYTSVTATLTDTNGTAWANALVTASFQPVPNNPNAPLNNGNAVKNPQTVVADGSGTFTISQLDDNSVVVPVGSTTKFVICPNASVGVCSQVVVSLSGPSQNLTALLSAQLTPVAVQASPVLPRAYNDAEVVLGGGLVYGSQYFRVSDFTLRLWNGTGFGGGGGGGPRTPGGSTTQLQYNNAGAFGGISNFTLTSNKLTLTQVTNGDNLFTFKRATDTGPTGTLIQCLNAASMQICYIDANGNIQAQNMTTGTGTGGSYLTAIFNASNQYQVNGVQLGSTNLSDSATLIRTNTFTQSQLPSGTTVNLYTEAPTSGNSTMSTGSALNMFTGYTMPAGTLTAGHRINLEFCFQHTSGTQSTQYALLLNGVSTNIFGASTSATFVCTSFVITASDNGHETMVQQAGGNMTGAFGAPVKTALTLDLTNTVVINYTENATAGDTYVGYQMIVDRD